MAIVMGLDQHRAQITAECIDTDTGELGRARVSPAHRDDVRKFFKRFAGQPLEVPYSPLGHGFLTGQLRSPHDLADDDWRKANPRFIPGNFENNLRIVDEVEAVASEIDATPAQVALAWLLAQGDDIAPIPGTKRVSRVEENTAAEHIELSAEQIARLSKLAPATGDRHDEANMSTIGR
jgi:aryl-alcohol dehydrogenase-like predicted oxidoreductase